MEFVVICSSSNRKLIQMMKDISGRAGEGRRWRQRQTETEKERGTPLDTVYMTSPFDDVPQTEIWLCHFT